MEGKQMNTPWHITVEVPDKDWGTPEGVKVLCGVDSPKIIRFQMFEILVKGHSVKESEVCKQCLEIFRKKERGGE